MQQAQRRWLQGITLAACLLFFGFTPEQSRALRLVLTQSADVAALRSLAEEFFAAYAKKDLESFIRLWSARSPDLESRKQAIQQLFTNHEKIEVRNLTVLKATVDGENAKLRVEVEMNAVEAKTGKAAAGFGQMKRVMHYVKEDGRWQIRRELSAAEDLADALVVAKTEPARAALLAEEKELETVDLRTALVAQGARFGSQGNYPQALTIYRLAQSIAERISDTAGMAQVQRRIGNVYFTQGNPGLALEPYQKSLTLYEALGDKDLMTVMLTNIGNVHYSQGNFTQALEYYQKGLALAETLENKARISDLLLSIGNVHYSQGNYDQALEPYQKSLKLAEASGDKNRIAGILVSIGRVFFSQGNYTQAMEYHQKSLTLAEASGNKYVIVRTLDSLGSTHFRQGNYAQALEYHQKSLTLAEASGDKPAIASAQHNMGNVYDAQGNYTQSLERFQEGLTLAEALGDKNGMAVALAGIGSVHRSQGNYAQALEHFQKGLTLAEASGNKDIIGRTLGSIGGVHHVQGNYTQALEYSQKTVKLAEASGDKDMMSDALGGVGGIYDSQGNYIQALESYQKSLALAEASGDKDGILRMLNNIANVNQTQGNYTQALDLASRSIALAKQIGYPSGLGFAQLIAGRSYRRINKLSQARQSFADAIATIETLRTEVAGSELDQQRFFENRLDSYHAITDLLVAENKTVEALAYAERAKARVLLDVLRSGRVDITKAMVPQEQEQERTLNNHLVSLNTQISRENARPQPNASRLNDLNVQLQKARLDYEAFQTSLYAAHPALKAQRGEVQPLTLAQAGDLLPGSKSALLEFAVTDERTFLFVLTRAGSSDQAPVELKVYSLEIKRKELAGRAARFRESLAKRDLGFRQPARELYDLLLKPAQAQLQGKNSLVIVPDDALWELPFQALQPAPTRYLLEDYAISYAPSMTVLREMTRLRGKKALPTPGSSTLLAFGNPALGKQTIQRVKSVLMDEKLDPLPEAERQVNTLRQIYGPAQSKVYIGSEAREDRAKMEAGNYRILHLATHGILNDRSPMYSHVLLAQAEGDASQDGLLEAWEILKLDLKADLAVLSACETARGRLGAGEGMIGLSWALFVAGCPTTVVSQWKVESSSTTELMVEFHKQLRGRLEDGKAPTTKAGALRTAALKLLRGNRSEYRHPFYWAGFVMVGEGF